MMTGALVGIWDYWTVAHETAMTLLRMDAHIIKYRINPSDDPIEREWSREMTIEEIEKELLTFRFDLYMSKAIDILDRNKVKLC